MNNYEISKRYIGLNKKKFKTKEAVLKNDIFYILNKFQRDPKEPLNKSNSKLLNKCIEEIRNKLNNIHVRDDGVCYSFEIKCVILFGKYKLFSSKNSNDLVLKIKTVDENFISMDRQQMTLKIEELLLKSLRNCLLEEINTKPNYSQLKEIITNTNDICLEVFYNRISVDDQRSISIYGRKIEEFFEDNILIVNSQFMVSTMVIGYDSDFYIAIAKEFFNTNSFIIDTDYSRSAVVKIANKLYELWVNRVTMLLEREITKNKEF